MESRWKSVRCEASGQSAFSRISVTRIKTWSELPAEKRVTAVTRRPSAAFHESNNGSLSYDHKAGPRCPVRGQNSGIDKIKIALLTLRSSASLDRRFQELLEEEEVVKKVRTKSGTAMVMFYGADAPHSVSEMVNHRLSLCKSRMLGIEKTVKSSRYNLTETEAYLI